MGAFTLGSVSVQFPTHAELPAESGTLTSDDLLELGVARSGIRSTCYATASMLRENSSRIAVPGMTPDQLEAAGVAVEDVGLIVAELEVVMHHVKQGHRLLQHEAHSLLRRVLAQLRAAEKFDPNLGLRFPELIGYFSNERQPTTVAAPPPAAATA